MKYTPTNSSAYLAVAAILLSLTPWIFGDWNKLNIYYKVGFALFLIAFFVFVIFLITKENKAQALKFENDKSKEIERIKKDNQDKLSRKNREIEEIKTLNKLNYAHTLPQIITGISEFINGFKRHKFIFNLNILLSNMSTYYRVIKGVECCFTVKIIDSEAGKIETIARTPGYSDRMDRESFVNKYDSFSDFLKENTDLASIYLSKSSKIEYRSLKFFCNNLIERRGFKHSLLDVEDFNNKIDKYPDDKKKEMEYASWPLPYKSTIVVPLGLMRANHEDDDIVLAGTLCVDANELNVFDEELDVSLLQSLAETIFLTWKSPNKLE